MAVVAIEQVDLTNTLAQGFSLPNLQAPVNSESDLPTTWLESTQSSSGKITSPKALQPERRLNMRLESVPMWADLFWFEHVHLIPTSFDLGNVLSDLTREFIIYNGYRKTSQRISNIIEDDTIGIEVDYPAVSPLVLRQKNWFDVEVVIRLNGPPSVDGTVTFQWTSGEVLVLRITGSRVLVISLVPQVPIEEELEWKTDVITAASGRTQRVALRLSPAQRFKLKFVASDQVMQWLENEIYGWSANTWAMPVWTDFTELAANASAGATSLTLVDASDRDFRADPVNGTALALIWHEYNSFEAVEVSAISGNTLTLLNGLTNEWAAGDLVLPVRLSKMDRPAQFTNNLAETKTLAVSMRSLQDASAPSIAGFTTFLDIPVFDDPLLVPGLQYQVTFDRDPVRFPSTVGKLSIRSERDFPIVRHGGLALNFAGRESYLRIKHFFEYCRGPQRVFWISSGRYDFTIRATTAAPTSTLRVNENNFGNHVGILQTRKYLEITFIDGTVVYRQVTAVSVTPGVGEDLTLSSSVAQDLSAANVERISYLLKVRLDDDTLQFSHQWYLGEVDLDIGLVEEYA